VSALVERMRGAHGAYTPNDITFSVRSMLDQHAHSLPGAMGSLKPIDAQVATVRHDLHQNLGFADGCGELWRRRSRQLFAHPLLRGMCFPRWTENAHAMRTLDRGATGPATSGRSSPCTRLRAPMALARARARSPAAVAPPRPHRASAAGHGAHVHQISGC